MLRVVVAICATCAIARADDGVRAPDAPPPPKQVGVVTKPPKLVQALAPEYPPAALAAGKQKRRSRSASIDATGVVTPSA